MYNNNSLAAVRPPVRPSVMNDVLFQNTCLRFSSIANVVFVNIIIVHIRISCTARGPSARVAASWLPDAVNRVRGLLRKLAAS
jgi:hypothetical protein